ncbi:MAG: hypothetical protein ACFFAN_00030 [Promethearchaeota archaeon]
MASKEDTLGIVAIILAVIGFFTIRIIFGILAIIIAAIGLSRERKNVVCVIGLVFGIIVLMLGIIGLIHAIIPPPPLPPFRGRS